MISKTKLTIYNRFRCGGTNSPILRP